MKQQYSLTSIWYWSLNSVAFIVATFGTIQTIVPIQPASPVKVPPQPVKKPFNLFFNPYKSNKSKNPDFRVSLLPLPNAETQKCEVFTCLPPNPFNNFNTQENKLNNQDLQKENYRYISSDIKSYKFDKLEKLNRINNLYIPVIPNIQPQTTQPIASGIFQGTYELYSQSSHKINTAETKPIQQISMTVGDAVYLALAKGADKNAYLVNIKTKPSTLKPTYKWNDVSNINQSKQLDIKLSLTKDTDKKIARLNELINRQDSRNALNSKITNVVLTYNKLLQAQEKVKIAEFSLKNTEELKNTNYRIPLLAAQNEVKARRLELATILEINNIEIITGEIPVIEPISLEFDNLQKIAFAYQPNYLRNRFNFEISQLVDKNKEIKAETLKNATLQLDTHLQNSINYINSIYSQVEGARQAVKLSEQQFNVEQEKFKLGKASQSELISRINELAQAQNNEVEVTVRYLNALANLDQLLGTTSETFRNLVSS
ncbi:MAG: TolC family protein [Calothrix sp. FI2-JRJ7]|jgi:hypothetical protein|nr:TolC family protein [Calothrix sp. FI2-JRJ7]